MQSNFFSKLRLLLNSRKIFKNWYIYPNVYYKFTKNKFVVFETKTNLKMKIRVNSTDLMALTNVWMIKEYNIENFNITENDKIIDVGAHIGLFSLLASQFCKSGKIFSFEPTRENFDLLVANLELNQIKNVFPFNLAVSKNPTKVDLFLHDDQSAHSVVSKSTKTIRVQSTSLQSIFDKNNIESCKLLKLDCEGAEYEIIDSLPSEYFQRIENMVIEYHLADSRPELVKNLINKIQNMGFKIETKPHYNDMGFLIARK